MSVNKAIIAKNTVMLYIRMIFVMGASLFTTRVVLQNLGVEDYGIFNVVAGVVTMFAFLNSSMASASQRFISFELGINDEKRINTVYCQSVIIHWVIGLLIILLAETIGLWFVYNKLTIPEDRFTSAIWVYQLSILSFLFQVINVPDQASIIAHEKMSIYAWVSIFDVSLKLCIAYLISISPFDKLTYYAFLILVNSVLMFFFYRIYTKRHFKECHFHFVLDREKFKEMFSFAGWNIIGDMAFTLRTQGSNILLNMFFGPVVNAARGVAHQVDGAVDQFVTNFQTASNPQIIKSYAQEEYDDTMKLVCQCSKFSFYLIIIITFPIIYQIDFILSLWLTNVPSYTAIFIQLILINGIIDSLSKALKTYIKATGRVKWYMIIQGGFYLLALPFIYLFLKFSYPPESSIIVLIVFTFLGTFLRIAFINYTAKGFSIKYYLKTVFIPALLVAFFAILSCSLYSMVFDTVSLLCLCVNSMMMVLIIAVIAFLAGMNKSEKKNLVSLFNKSLEK